MSSTAPLRKRQGIKPVSTDRRVRKNQQALRDAFISLVLEHGYESVTVEDIAERADVARATFYAHFDDKDDLLTTLFYDLTEELADQIVEVEVAPDAWRTQAFRDLYLHAAQHRDLYLVCLRGAGNGRARAAYSDVIAARAEFLFAERLQTLNRESGVPISIMGRALAGAHTALLETWLEDEDQTSLDAMVRMEIELLSRGFAWSLGMLPEGVVAQFPEV